jgi:transcriptional regulator with XRE-family HTH domain
LVVVKKQLFGRRLRELRVIRGYATARQFAEALGISENKYTRYERGVALPKIDLLHLIFEKLGTSPNDLFGFKDEGGTPTKGVLRGLAESSSAPSQGFSGGGSDSGQAASSEHPAPPESDFEGWQLAAEFAKIRARSGAGQDASKSSKTAFSELQETSRLFVELRSDPFGTIAAWLSDPALAVQPAKVHKLITSKIDHYLRIIRRPKPKPA